MISGLLHPGHPTSGMSEDDASERVSMRRDIEELSSWKTKSELRLYRTKSLNEKLYLNNRGYHEIEGLDEFSGLKALYCNGNGAPLAGTFAKHVAQRALFSLH
eukprot:GHVU01040370.1.p3 GENE.GHVU01040370.1~~GHVU01040370.1.p3  ORF type:complete len:103 (-),score=8.60 GHVU01040370.1:1102-1410(-)